MTTIWEHTQRLKGETLYTISRHKPFDVIDVLSDRIVFVPHDGKGTPRWASREQIEHLCGLARGGQDVNRKLVQEIYPSDYNTSYMAAIIKAIALK